jgi:lysophospholipase L1-like esterase
MNRLLALFALVLVGACDAESAPAPSVAAVDAGSDASPGDGGLTSDATVNVDASPKADGAPPAPPAIRFVGRFDTRDPAGPRCSFSGCRIIADYTGTDVSVRLAETPGITGSSELDVVVDGVVLPQKLSPTAGAADYALTTGLAPGPHQIELYRRTEASDGVTQFLGFSYGGGGRLLAPRPAPTRRIEIVGDSTTTGYGVEGAGPTCPDPGYSAKYKNFRKAFGARLGARFGADVVAVSYSGKGLTQNLYRPDTLLLPTLYRRALADDPASTWSFPAGTAPDAVFLMVGANDFTIGVPVDNGPASYADFEAAYKAFVADIRSKYPVAHVWCLVSPGVSDAFPVGRNMRSNIRNAAAATVAARAAAGDARVYLYELPEAEASDKTACDYHPNAALHQRMADTLAPLVTSKLGW